MAMTRGVLGEALHVVEVGGGEQARLVRVDSDGGVDPGIALGEGDGAGEVVGAVSVADGEQGADAGIVGALDDGFAIRGELGAVEMGVGVEEHGEIIRFSEFQDFKVKGKSVRGESPCSASSFLNSASWSTVKARLGKTRRNVVETWRTIMSVSSKQP